jgi:hypothetical protein
VEVGTNHISEAAVPASEAKSAKASPASVITEDLASFVVANQIILTAPTTIEQVKQHFSHNAEIAPLVNHTLNALQDAELISIQDGKIEALVNDLSVGSDIDALERFVPNLFKRTASQILNDARTQKKTQRQEGLQYFVIPNDPELANEAKALFEEFRFKMLRLTEKARNYKGEPRVIGVLNCLPDPEEYV